MWRETRQSTTSKWLATKKIGSRKDSAFMCARGHLTDGPHYENWNLLVIGLLIGDKFPIALMDRMPKVFPPIYNFRGIAAHC